VSSLLFFHRSRDHRDLHSFPTRRSSDLPIYNDYQWPPETEVEWHNAGIRYPTWGNTDAIFTAKDGESKAIVDWKTSASAQKGYRSEEHTSELQSRENLVCRLLLEKKKKN